jgi:hypothetical protein
VNYLSLADIRRYAKGVVSAEDIRVIGEIDAVSALISGMLHGAGYSLPLLTAATGAVAFGAAPADGDTLTVGDKTYRFKDTLAQANDVKRTAGSATLCADALVAALDLDPLWSGTYYYATGANPNGYCTGVNTAGTVALTARAGGTVGNKIVLSDTSTALACTAFSGGAGSYSALRMIGVDLVQSVLIRGQAVSAIETDTQRSARDLWEAAMARFRALLETGLVDDDGTTPGMATSALPTSTTRSYLPEVGTREPEAWGWDNDRVVAESE